MGSSDAGQTRSDGRYIQYPPWAGPGLIEIAHRQPYLYGDAEPGATFWRKGQGFWDKHDRNLEPDPMPVQRAELRRFRADQARLKLLEKNDVTYARAHQRTGQRRGAATRRRCIECSGPAAQWCYLADSRTVLQTVIRAQNRRLRVVDYSPWIYDYVAMCERCHHRLDHLDSEARRRRSLELRRADRERDLADGFTDTRLGPLADQEPYWRPAPAGPPTNLRTMARILAEREVAAAAAAAGQEKAQAEADLILAQTSQMMRLAEEHRRETGA